MSKIPQKLKDFNYKPCLILAVIIAIVTGVLVISERSLHSDNEAISGKLKDACFELMGEGEYEVVFDWLEAGYAIEKPQNVDKLIINTDSGALAFQVITKGYNKNGLNMLIVMNEDGSVKELTVVENTETPGIGTKVNDRKFLNNFIGKSSEVRIVKSAPKNNSEVSAITSATKSSRGVAEAVNIAVETYALLFGEDGETEENAEVSDYELP